MTPDQKKTFCKQIRLIRPHGSYKRHWLLCWVRTFSGFNIPNKKVCADHHAPFTAFADAFFGASSKGHSSTAFVCHGSRLFGGKTFLQGLLACTRMILLGAECYILDGSKDQTAVMRRYLFQTSLRTKGVWGGIGRGLRAC
jgi:hypothetical protein